jgi:hypothetical protein
MILSDGDHIVYSGRLPLFAMSLRAFIQPLNNGQATIIFGPDDIEEYYYTLFGKSIAQLNYLYGHSMCQAIANTFHSLYPISHISAYSSQLTFKNLNMMQTKELCSYEAIVQVLGSTNSTLNAEYCKFDVKAFAVSNKPCNITVTDSYVNMNQLNYFINAKHSESSISEVLIRETIFEGDLSNIRHKDPLVYLENYHHFHFYNNTVSGYHDLKGMPTIMSV